MEILKYLQGIRNPRLTEINLVITEFGSEIIVIGILCLLYWCIDKKFAYRIGFVYFVSGLFIQILKVVFRVPRPWVSSSLIKPVNEAVPGATGYSFPSGHTQSATALYGTIAYYVKKTSVQIAMAVIILLVAFSRMYLGVHTPWDVTISFLLTVVITLFVNYVIDKKLINNIKKEILAGMMLLIPIGMILYGIIFINNGSVQALDAMDYFKAAGAALGFIIGWYLESKYVNFDERKGTMLARIIKFTVGIILTLLLKSGLKTIIGESFTASFIRYAIVVFFVIYIYPLMFSKWQILRKKAKHRRDSY